MSSSQISQQVATAIVTYKGKILLLLRDDNIGIKDPGMWQLPGGGIEEGETPEEAVRRELKEEICVTPKNIRFLGEPETGIFVYHAILFPEEVAQVVKGDEGKELSFFSLLEMENLPLTRKLRATLSVQKSLFESLLNVI